MIIGIDSRATEGYAGGRGRLVVEILRSLCALPHDHRFALYCRRPAQLPFLDARFKWVAIDRPAGIWHAAAALDANRRCDCFFATNSYLPLLPLRIPGVALVCDLVAFAAFRHAHPRARINERLSLGMAVRRAERLLCISHSTRRDLVERYPRAESKAGVLPLAADSHFGEEVDPAAIAAARARYDIAKPYVLAVGTLEPRKNLVRLIEAFRQLPPDLRDERQLVLVGPTGWHASAISDELAAGSSDVRTLGYVPDSDLAPLYRGCELFCYPSLYEGFGLPLLEALQSGAPSLASNSSSLPEIGAGAAVYADPESTADIARNLESLLRSPERRAELASAGPERARAYSWEATATTLLTEIERLGEGRPRAPQST